MDHGTDTKRKKYDSSKMNFRQKGKEFLNKNNDRTVPWHRKNKFSNEPNLKFKHFERRNATTFDGEDSNENGKRIQKMSNYKKAHVEYDRVKAKKFQEREEANKRKMEINESLEKYYQKKREKSRKLAAKTKKGQPIMKNRIEMLLEKIQSSN